MLVLTTSGCGRPIEIIAHRGDSGQAPENTLAALRLAWEQHVDAEVDIHMSRDGRVAVIHDATTKRTAGVNLKVSLTDWTELSSLDVGSFKGERFAGERIPLLEEAITTIPSGRKLFIEIKCGKEVLPALSRLIAESGKKSQIAIIGFDLDTVTASRKLIDVPTYWLRSTARYPGTQWVPHDPKLAQTAKDKGLDGLDVHYGGVTPQFVRAVRTHGLKLYVWTVDDPDQAARLVELGVDGITTNHPGRLSEHLKECGSPADRPNATGKREPH